MYVYQAIYQIKKNPVCRIKIYFLLNELVESIRNDVGFPQLQFNNKRMLKDKNKSKQ